MSGPRRVSSNLNLSSSRASLNIQAHKVSLVKERADSKEAGRALDDNATPRNHRASAATAGHTAPTTTVASKPSSNKFSNAIRGTARVSAKVARGAATTARKAAEVNAAVTDANESTQQVERVGQRAVHRAGAAVAKETAKGTAKLTGKAAMGTAKLTGKAAKGTGKAVRGGIVAAQKRTAAAKAAKASADTAVSVGRASAATARVAAAAASAVKGVIAAVATAASSTPVIAIITAVCAAIVAVLALISFLPGVAPSEEPDDPGNWPVGVAPGPWGGHENGKIPEDELSPIPWATEYVLRADAVEALVALNEAYTHDWQTGLIINDAYRDYDGQVAARDDWCSRGHCENAAVPGTSNHGWALAVDFGGAMQSFGTEQYKWMKLHAPEFGFRHPDWAEPDGSAPEPWHWDFWGWEGASGSGGGTGSGIPESDVQSYAQSELSDVFGLMSDPDAQFSCLQTLWTNESGWNYQATNPTSGAYGIPQALPGSKMASAGSDWETNPKTQVDWGLQYIHDRYGTPCQAWDFWQAQTPAHWY